MEMYRKRHRENKISVKVVVNDTRHTLITTIVHVPSLNPIGTWMALHDGAQRGTMMDVHGQG